jgi:hypothetical protein
MTGPARAHQVGRADEQQKPRGRHQRATPFRVSSPDSSDDPPDRLIDCDMADCETFASDASWFCDLPRPVPSVMRRVRSLMALMR